MEFELALRLPQEDTATVLPLRLAYRQGILLVLDHAGGLAQLTEDWEAANDLAGVTGRIVHWYEGTGARKTGTYGFEAVLLESGRRDTNTFMWLTFSEFGVPAINVIPEPSRTSHDLAMPLSGAEFVRGRCTDELQAIQALLQECHPAEIEDDIKDHAPWLKAGGGMKVGSGFSLYGDDIAEEAVVFDYPDRSQMAVTALSIHLAPVTFTPESTQRVLWGQFGRA
jgi:hypothetical protein